MNKKQAHREVIVICVLCFLIGLFIFGSPVKERDYDNGKYEYDEKDAYTVSVIQEDYDKINKDIEDIIKANNGKVKEEFDWESGLFFKPLRNKEWILELTKNDFTNFIRDFRSLEGEGNSFYIRDKEIVNQDDKNTKMVSIVLSEYVSEEHFAIYVMYKKSHPWLS